MNYLCSMNWNDQRPDDAMAGAFEAIGPEPVSTVPVPQFREAMSRLGAAVHVVTTAGPAGKTGFTATAVCSVSDAPPTLLVCLHRRNHTGPILRENKVFCVNTLGAECEAVADIFAGRTGAVMDERFLKGVDDAQDRRAAAGFRRGRLRLPGGRDQGGGEPQRDLRRRRRHQDRARWARRSSITSERISSYNQRVP